MKGVVNLTPRSLTIFTPEGKLTIPTSGYLRLVEEDLGVRRIAGIEYIEKRFDGVNIRLQEVPDEVEVVIVDSELTALALTLVEEPRAELQEKFGEVVVLTPDTFPRYVVRDDRGKVVGFKRLFRYKFK